MKKGVSLSNNLTKQPYTQKPLQAKQMLCQQPLTIPENMISNVFSNQQQQYNFQLLQIQQLKGQFNELQRMITSGKQNLSKIRLQKQMIQFQQQKQWRQGNVELQILKQRYKQTRLPLEQKKLSFYNVEIDQLNKIEDKLQDLIDLNE